MKKIYLFSVLTFLFPVLLIAQNNQAVVTHTGVDYHEAAPVKNTGNQILNDGSGALGLTYNKTACGLNYVQGSVLIEKRSLATGDNVNGTGLPTSITISGLPADYVIDKAYLWYTVSYYETTAPNSSASMTNSLLVTTSFNAALIGTGVPKCWGERGTAAYRADVTSIINGNGIYGLDISGFSDKSGEVDGATLMIIYKDSLAANQGTLTIWDGIMTSGQNGSPYVLRTLMTGLNICANSIYANAFIIASDMQEKLGEHIDTINGTTRLFTNDFWNFDTINTAVSAGQTSVLFSAFNPPDCFSVCTVGLYYQDGCASCALATSVPVYANSQQQVTVFPNPAAESVSIRLASPANDAQVVIYDLPGQEIFQEKFTGNQLQIQTRSLSAGVYFLKVIADRKQYINKLIIE